MTSPTTLQLLFRNWYAGVDIGEAEAVEELERRGWTRPLRAIALGVVVPFVLVERIVVASDLGDPWEAATTSTLAFSASFSAWISLPFVVLGAIVIAGLRWPALAAAAIYVALSAMLFVPRWWLRRRRANVR